VWSPARSVRPGRNRGHDADSDQRRGQVICEDGASGVEYGLLIAAIAAAIVGIVFVIGQVVHDQYDVACTAIHGEIAGDDCPP
jgi:Flp pilus assembly pilin Flp